MKKILTLITLCLLFIGIVFPFNAFASQTSANFYLADEAGVLSDTEKNMLEKKLSETSAKYNTSVVALLTDRTGIDPNSDDYDYQLQEYSDAYLQNYVFQTGNEDAILLTVDTAGRGYHFSTHGDTIYSFTDYGIVRMGEELTGTNNNPGPLRNSDWGGAVGLYNDLAGGMIDYRNNNGIAYGQTENTGEQQNDRTKNLPLKGVIGILVGLLGSFGITNGMKNQLKSVQTKTSAADYFKLSDLKLRAQKDTFLYMNVSRVPIRTDPPKNSGGGGFTTHTSSGGGSFGGGGGRF